MQTRLIGKIKDFFEEFDFSGATSIRFYNTLLWQAKKGKAQKYVLDYFRLIDSPYIDDVKEKLKSKEFKLLMDEYKKIQTDVQINKRLEIYYGNQGGGKTTTAIKNNPDAYVMTCSSNLEPNDLLEAFDFVDGKPKYKNTQILNAMLEGKKVILDEMNLLPRNSLRAVQGWLDNKSEFVYKDKLIQIKEGFGIICTMNLEVNGQIEELPAPLVDRAYEIVEMIPSNEFIAKLAFEGEGLENGNNI